MTETAKNARRAYKREWAKKNPDKIKKYQETYWNKKAENVSNDITLADTEEMEARK